MRIRFAAPLALAWLIGAATILPPASGQVAPAPDAPTQAAPPAAAPPATTLPASPPAVLPVAPPVTSPAPPAASAPSPSPAPVPTPSSAPAPDSGIAALLPSDLSPWSMFLNADIVVKIVICSLVFASLVTWTIWLAKTLELAAARRQLRRALATLRATPSLEAAQKRLAGGKGVVGALMQTVFDEWRKSADLLDDRDGIKERIALQFERIEAAAARGAMMGTGILATIGSTAPFVGLFGTVWGIMNSFIGISKLHTTNLAVVAPGIAEALLATAVGLVAAIPAVVIYNHFARQIGGYKAMTADAAASIMRLVSRELAAAARPDSDRPLRAVAE
jgi:biopolymer transport protein ExbB